MTRRALLVLACLTVGACHAPAVSARPDGGSAPAARRPLFYRSPMNPRITSPVPRKDEMGMDYVPVYAEPESEQSQVPGLAAVTIDETKRQLIGLRTVEVKRESIGASLHTSARVTFDEQRVQVVTARFAGYVEKLSADFTGKRVVRGQPLLSIYSPELLATERELLLARSNAGALGQAGLPNAAASARDRLLLFGIPESEIARLEARGEPERALTLVSPLSGFVIEKSVTLGARVEPNAPLFRIADLSRVWVMADIYERDLPGVRVGQRAVFTLPYWPGQSWSGVVSDLLPTLDPQTRTVKARIALENPRFQLRPEMFGNVEIETAPRTGLVIPEDALIVTGRREVVFVALGKGRLIPREVETGRHQAGRVEVLKGLSEGDRIAAGASFLLDSEARLRSLPPPEAGAADGGAP